MSRRIAMGMDRTRLLRVAWLACLCAAGCAPETAVLLEVSASAPAVARLDFYAAHQSFCDRWVEDGRAPIAEVDVQGRNLGTRPYDLLVTPVHTTDLKQLVYYIALARNGAGVPIGEAVFGAHPFAEHQVLKLYAAVNLFGVPAPPVGPTWVADDGCICVPGQPWLGNGTGSGCDPRVVTSFARLSDTAGCTLPAGAPLPVPVCDGQSYPGETPGRTLPCFHAVSTGGMTACRVALRRCTDQNGRAYDQACAPGGSDPAMSDSALCDAYLKCEQTACSDALACVRAALPASSQVTCTLMVDASAVMPCADGKWQAALPSKATGAACTSTVLDGTAQPPFTIGLAPPPDGGAAATVSAACPPTLQVDKIDAKTPADLPDHLDLDLTEGDQVVHVHITVVRGCGTGPSLVCH